MYDIIKYGIILGIADNVIENYSWLVKYFKMIILQKTALKLGGGEAKNLKFPTHATYMLKLWVNYITTKETEQTKGTIKMDNPETLSLVNLGGPGGSMS